MSLEKLGQLENRVRQKTADVTIHSMNAYMKWGLKKMAKEFPKSASIAMLREYQRLRRPIDIEMPIRTEEKLRNANVVVVSRHGVDPGIALAGLPPRCDNEQRIILSEDNLGYLPPEVAEHAAAIDIDYQQTKKNAVRKVWMWWKGGPKRSPKDADEYNIGVFRNLIRTLRKKGGVVVMMPQGIHTDEEEWLDGPVTLLRMLSKYNFHIVQAYIAAAEKISPGLPAVFTSPATVIYGEAELLSDMFERLAACGITEDKDIARILQQENQQLKIDAPEPLMRQKTFWKLFTATSIAALGISLILEKKRHSR